MNNKKVIDKVIDCLIGEKVSLEIETSDGKEMKFDIILNEKQSLFLKENFENTNISPDIWLNNEIDENVVYIHFIPEPEYENIVIKMYNKEDN